MDEQRRRIREFLSKEYGIRSDEDLLRAIEQDRGIDLGVFTGGKEDAKAKVC